MGAMSPVPVVDDDSGATAHPAGSATVGSGVGSGSDTAAAATPAPANVGAKVLGVSAAECSAAADAAAAAAAGARSAVDESASRTRKAVTSPPVGTMLITVQPSPDFSVSFAARAAGS